MAVDSFLKLGTRGSPLALAQARMASAALEVAHHWLDGRVLIVPITTSGDTFTGRTEGRMGAQDISGKVDGDALTWSANITNPMPMTLDFTARIDGDKMTGTVKLGAFGNAPMSGERI